MISKKLQNAYENYVVLNQGKYHFMCLGKNTKNKALVFKNKIMKRSQEQKIIGIVIDNKLNFKSHVTNLRKKIGL